MFERHKTNLAKAALLLYALKAHPDRFHLLLELQRLLVRRITWTERAIQRSKAAGNKLKASLSRDRPPKRRAKAIKTLLKASTQRVDELRHLLFLWRCFGDGIASIYQSTFNLKHLFFDSNYAVKQSAGFITGKEGFKREWAVLLAGIKAEVPVVLSDLTNLVRVGDVCVLAGPDPFPIEIKSSQNSNARRARQEQHIRDLEAFYKNDGAKNFRGIPNVERFALSLPQVSYEVEINACIKKGLQLGFATAAPEPGLRYIAAKPDIDFAEPLQPFITRTTLVRLLSPDEGWLPCYPFTLTLTPANLLPFISFEVTVVVLIDLLHLKNLFAKNGITATMLMDGVSAMQICPDPTDLSKGAFRIHELLFARVALEFQSLEWFAAEHSGHFDTRAPKVIDASDVPALLANGELIEIGDEWLNVKDCWLTSHDER